MENSFCISVALIHHAEKNVDFKGIFTFFLLFS